MNRFSAEVAEYQAQGVSIEKAFTLVSAFIVQCSGIRCYFTLYNFLLLFSAPCFISPTLFLCFLKTYQTAEDLGKAFADLAILRTFLEAELAESTGELKVLKNLH